MTREREQFRMEEQTPEQQPENQTKAAIEAIQQFGQMNVPAANESNIFCLTIVGQIEGHMVLPPQNKTTKYEHIIPTLVAAEQNKNIDGILIILNTVGGGCRSGAGHRRNDRFPDQTYGNGGGRWRA